LQPIQTVVSVKNPTGCAWAIRNHLRHATGEPITSGHPIARRVPPSNPLKPRETGVSNPIAGSVCYPRTGGSFAMHTDPILIFGAGGHAKVVAEVARARGLEVAGFLEDAAARDGQPFFGARVIAWDRFAADPGDWPGLAIALAVGDNAGRARAYERVRTLGRAVVSLVHPSAVISPTATLGEGTVAFATAVVNAEARVGIGVILNTGAIVEHDAVVGDFAHISPNAALGGGAVVGARAHVGLGAVVLPRMEVGADARVGAGAVVRQSVAPGTTVVGVPARPIG
jgi:sugar O-acyltransferase (sialic acid O-acetyltransferase NeuD family)